MTQTAKIIVLSAALLLVGGIAFVRSRQVQWEQVGGPTPSVQPTPPPPSAPSPPPPPPQDGAEAQRLVQQGDRLYAEQRYAEALQQYRAALALTPADAAVWVKRGNAEREVGDKAAALSSYARARAYDERNGDAYLNAAAILWEQGRREEAKALLSEGIAKDASRKADLEMTLETYEALS